MYDKNMLCVLPAHSTTAGTGVPLAMALTGAATTEANNTFTAAVGGMIDSILLQVTVAIAWNVAAVLAVHVNDVEVGVATLPLAAAVNTMRAVKVVPSAGQNLSYKAGDVLKIEIKTISSGGANTGTAIPYLGVRSD